MIKLSYEEAVSKIKESANLTEEEINSRVNAKLSQFSGLVSREGAAHIVANELGVKLIQPAQQAAKLKIANILSGMQNVEVLAKIINIYPAKQFNTNGREGQVGSIFMGDDSGVMRSVFWNDQANKLQFLNKDDIVRIKGAYVRQNRNDQLELHLNDRSNILVNPPGETVEVKEYKPETPRRKINEIKDDDRFVEVLGTIIEVFDLKFFEDKRNSTPEKPVYSYLVSVFLDDGTAAVRTVFFRDTVQQLTKKSHEDLMKFQSNPQGWDSIKNDPLGNFVKINARVNKNEMYNRIELIANDVEETKPEVKTPEFEAASSITTPNPQPTTESQSPTSQPTPAPTQPENPATPSPAPAASPSPEPDASLPQPSDQK